MRRFIEKELKRWKEDERRKPLLLRGARQIGKTFTLRKFVKENFNQLVELNLEKQPELCQIFDTFEPKRILDSIQLITKTKVISQDTLIFIDEIQECPKAIMALRYFKEEMPEIPIIGAGSLLEFTLNDPNFKMPVGRIQFLYMYPLSFFEFLIVSGNEQLYNFLQTLEINTQIEEVVHQRLLKLVDEYMILGGMPEVLDDYFARQDQTRCQDVQTDILATYRKDFGKYAKTTQYKYLQMIFDKAPRLIAQWFKYSKIDAEVQSRDLKKALHLLCDAGLIYPVYATTAEGIPLNATINERKFKLLFLDIGLVQRAMHMEISFLMENESHLINRGALMEQYVGQQLLTITDRREAPKLFFWVREVKGSSAEVDYVINVDENIFPIEVKSGTSKRLLSLNMFKEMKKSPFGIRISPEQLSAKDGILNIPPYAVELINQLVRKYSK